MHQNAPKYGNRDIWQNVAQRVPKHPVLQRFAAIKVLDVISSDLVEKKPVFWPFLGCF